MEDAFVFVVKCNECGNEYQLNDGDKPENYQCDCGGSLKNTKRSNIFKILLIVILVIVFYFIGFISMWALDTTNIL